MDPQETLSERLARLGIPEGGRQSLPLRGAHAERVFSAAAELAGTDYLQWLWDELYVQLRRELPAWDGSYGGLIEAIRGDLRIEGWLWLPRELRTGWLFYQVLAEPFLFIERAREAEEKYSGRIREIQEENKKLRASLSEKGSWVN